MAEMDARPDWRGAPHNRWAFWHVPDLLPTQAVRCASTARPLPAASPTVDVRTVAVDRVDGTSSSLASVLTDSYTDACVVLHDGAVVFEEYAEEGHPDLTHTVMSVTKPLVGCVTAILVEQEMLDPARLVTDYVPELAVSGYAGASVRDLLDMRSGIRFREEYEDATSEASEMDRWVAASQRGDDGNRLGAYPYLLTLEADSAHGGTFRYRSAETVVLGWVCERASGQPMADLLSRRIWGPMGAEHDARLICDGAGTAMHAGGLCATARDVARFGQLLLDGGTVPSSDGGRQVVVPARWLRQAWAVDADIRGAFADSPAELMFPGGWFRNQFWFRPGPYGDVLVCLGVYGQMVHVNRTTRTVCVKLSSWPTVGSPALLQDTIRSFDAVGGALSNADAREVRQRLPGVVTGM
ncbi:MAG: beta-lactamase family protein [Humibacillus sp.]|nr:beta-lactamase family protein [Humibacillus sp.]MDN5776570.1 beta-lactamase family protein [Humibacillus sp.]